MSYNSRPCKKTKKKVSGRYRDAVGRSADLLAEDSRKLAGKEQRTTTCLHACMFR